MSAPLTKAITQDGIEAEIERPDPALVVSGDSVHTTWSVEETADGILSGMWQATPGKWKVDFSEWEYVNIHSGHSILTDEAGNEVHLKAGDRYVIQRGFKGTWEVIETTLKDYVIKL